VQETGQLAAALRDVGQHRRGIGRPEPASGDPAGAGGVAQARVAELVDPGIEQDQAGAAESRPEMVLSSHHMT
jgi:hypothetical protein